MGLSSLFRYSICVCSWCCSFLFCFWIPTHSHSVWIRGRIFLNTCALWWFVVLSFLLWYEINIGRSSIWLLPFLQRLACSQQSQLSFIRLSYTVQHGWFIQARFDCNTLWIRLLNSFNASSKAFQICFWCLRFVHTNQVLFFLLRLSLLICDYEIKYYLVSKQIVFRSFSFNSSALARNSHKSSSSLFTNLETALYSQSKYCLIVAVFCFVSNTISQLLNSMIESSSSLISRSFWWICELNHLQDFKHCSKAISSSTYSWCAIAFCCS